MRVNGLKLAEGWPRVSPTTGKPANLSCSLKNDALMAAERACRYFYSFEFQPTSHFGGRDDILLHYATPCQYFGSDATPQRWRTAMTVFPFAGYMLIA